MKLWKSYSTVITSLFLLLFAITAACSQPPATIEEQPASQKPAEFEVGPITLDPPVIMVGDSVIVSTIIRNTGDITGTYSATLLVNGQQVDRKDIEVGSEGSQGVAFQISENTAGNYNVSIGNSSAILTVHNWNPYTIQYDKSDGVSVCIYVSGENGHIVQFTPPNKAFKIQKIKIFGTVSILKTSDFDKNHVTARIWDKENNLLWSQDLPWRLFEGPANWREIKVPDIRVNDDFYVELVTHSNPARYRSDGSISYGGDPIEFVQLSFYGFVPGALSGETPSNIVVIGFDYPQSYINAPSNRPETRSGYSYMGKLIDPGAKRFKGINWLIRVEGEGAAGN